LRLLPRARRRATIQPRPRSSALPAVRVTATSVTLALAATILPGLGLSLPEAAADTGSVRDVQLPLEVGTLLGPARLEAGKLRRDPAAADRHTADATAAWQSHPVDIGDARMLGLSWVGAGSNVRVRTEGEAGWSDWEDLETDGGTADPGSPDDQHPDRVFSQPLWLEEGTRAVEVQATLPEADPETDPETNLETTGGAEAVALGDLRAHLITPDMTPTPSAEPGAGAAEARADAPAIISRARWGADERLRRGNPTYIRHVQVGFLHHTVQTNTYRSYESAALVRGAYLYHTQTQGFADIGYNLLVDRYGNIFEGRAGGVGQAVMGAHTGGFNHASFGVAMIGDFDRSQVPGAAHSALARLFAWKMDLHHIDPQGASRVTSTGGGTSRYPSGEVVRLNAISGHRDVGNTACPGSHGYEFLSRLRVGVARTGLPKIYGGRVSRTTIYPGGEPVITGVSFSAHVNWTAIITGSNGQELRRWTGQGTATRLVWDGRTSSGALAPAGVATLRVYANWRGLHARPVVANIRVIR
jgi:hypothetical protein